MNMLLIGAFCPQNTHNKTMFSVIHSSSMVAVLLLKPASVQTHARLLLGLFYFEEINVYTKKTSAMTIRPSDYLDCAATS
jgi:hypothetical protein